MVKIAVFSILFFSFNAFGKDWVEVFKEDGISIKTIKDKPGVMPFKAEGVLNHNINQIVKTLKDYKKKNEWSPKLKSVKMHEEKGQDVFIFSEFYKTPWPASDREFLLKGSVKEIKNGVVSFEASSIDLPKLVDSNHVQAQVHKLNVLLERIGPLRTKMTFEFYGDLGGWIPTWLMNVIQKKWPLRFLQSLDSYIKN